MESHVTLKPATAGRENFSRIEMANLERFTRLALRNTSDLRLKSPGFQELDRLTYGLGMPGQEAVVHRHH